MIRIVVSKKRGGVQAESFRAIERRSIRNGARGVGGSIGAVGACAEDQCVA